MDGIFGLGLFESVVVKHDYVHKILTFTVPEKYEHVIAGEPAAEAGLKQGDIILAIDGVSTEELVLPGVRERIRSEAPGKKLTLLLDSDGKERTVTITLRDLI